MIVTLTPSFKDDWYEGYFIPKGTTVIANIWYGVYGITRESDIKRLLQVFES